MTEQHEQQNEEETNIGELSQPQSPPSIPLASAAALITEDYDFSVKGILNSIAKRAFQDREKSMEDPDPPKILQEHPNRIARLEELLLEGAKWMELKKVNGVPVQRLADVSYGSDSPMQCLDIYFPRDEESEASTSTPEKRPVYIHIHGGGWSRGAKDSIFYGGPAMCQNATAEAGCISVAVGYRLGKYPEFVHDAANAIQWVYQNLEALGGDMDNVFLSGHSAGAHISSLLMLRHDHFLEPLGVPMKFFKGLVLVSGVYDLFRPMQLNVLDAKNKWFVLAYVTPAFGTDTKLKREASPLLLLDPEKDTSLMGAAMRRVSAQLPSLSLKKQFSRLSVKSMRLKSNDEENDKPERFSWKETDDNRLPPTLILNATYDMGLQENGQLMAEALSEYTRVRYQIVEGADHASICWNETTSKIVGGFVMSLEESHRATMRDKLMPNSNTPPKKRRGKRDKIPPKPAGADDSST